VATEEPTSVAATTVHARLDDVMRLLERQRVLTSLASRGSSPRQDLVEQLQHRQNLVELQRHLRTLHPADIAAILESLPIEERRLVFRQLGLEDAGRALVEVGDSAAESLVADLARDDLVRLLRTLDADDLAYLSGILPADVLADVSATLEQIDRSWLTDSLSFPENSVGRLMTPDAVAVQETMTVGEVLDDLRSRGELPDQTDRVFVVDVRHVLRGAVPLHALVRGDPTTPVRNVMIADMAVFSPMEPAVLAAKAFERYDLVSAPVVDARGKVIGRVRIDNVMDYVRESSDLDVLARAGLRGAEDLFASVRDSVGNRWPWLCLNLVTAFLASRVIAQFEATIAQVVALAALMPVVASIGGNTGNQTVALVIRAIALDQLRDQYRQLLRKELTVGAVNGVTWGLVMGLVSCAIYRDLALGAVMMSAVVLNLMVAAVAGIVVPIALHRANRDPAQGASVVLTFITDSMGFFLFLGLARLFLL
jgi:magnesium transporter